MGSLEYAIPSVGGFCVGTSYVVDHQRFSGLGNLPLWCKMIHSTLLFDTFFSLGYCFSASLPPMLAAAAITAIDCMESNPDMFLDLNTVCRQLHSALSSLHQLRLGGHRDAPVKHLRLAKSTGCHNHDGQLLRQIANEVHAFFSFLPKTIFNDYLFFASLVNEKRFSCYCGLILGSIRTLFTPAQFAIGCKPSAHRKRFR